MDIDVVKLFTRSTRAVGAVAVSALILAFALGIGAKAQNEERRLLFKATRTTVDVRGSTVKSGRTCLALYRNGQYVLETHDQGLGPIKKVGHVFEGVVSDSELHEIVATIDSKELRDIATPYVENQSHRHLEMLGLGIPRESGEQKLHFVDSDGQSSFTPSASAIDDWLKKIEIVKGTRVKDAKQTVCMTSP